MESRGDSASDFVELGSFTISGAKYTSPTPQRVIQGTGPYILDIIGLDSADNIQIYKDACGAVSGVAVNAGGAILTLNTSTTGEFKVCGRSKEYFGLGVSVIPPPTFSPLGFTAGVTSTIQFVGVVPGDLVVLKQGGCGGVTSQIQGSSFETSCVSVGSDLSILLDPHLAPGKFSVCVASKETNGSLNSHFVTLTTELVLSPLDFRPRRIAAGSGLSTVSVTGVNADEKAFFSIGECRDGITSIAAVAHSATVLVALPSSMIPGSWKLCHMLVGQNPFHTGLFLIVVAQPTFTPIWGQSGQPTAITFHGVAVGDWVALTSLSTCVGVAELKTGTASLRKTTVMASGGVVTAVAMSANAQLTVCYATAESKGDNDTDFVALNVTFIQSSVAINTSRLIVGTGTHYAAD